MKFPSLNLLPLTLLIPFISLIWAQTTQPYDASQSNTLFVKSDFSKASNLVILVLTTSDPTASSSGFFFNPKSQIRVPRVITAVKVNAINTTLGQAVVPPLELAEATTNITTNYIKVTSSSKPTFTITASSTINTADFPSTDQSLEAVIIPSSLLPDITDYLTLIYNTIIQHNSTIPLTCQYTLDYMGFIRSIFFNDDREGQWGPQTDNIKTTQSYTSGSIRLKPDEMMLVTLIGFRLNVVSLKIVNCKDDTGLPTPVNIVYYRPGNRVVAPEIITFTNQTSSCETSSTRCVNINTSLKCAAGLYRVDDQCRRICPLNKPTVNSFGDCTEFGYDQIRRGFKTVVEQTNNSLTKFQYYLDLPAQTSVLTIFWPSEDLVMPSTPIWFPKGSFLLPKAVFVTNALPTTGTLKYSTQLNLIFNDQLLVGTQRKIIYTHHRIISDTQKSMIIVMYPQEPVTEDDMRNPFSFTYMPFNQSLTLDPTTFTYMTTLINCRQSCSLSIQADGKVQGFQDLRTFLFSIDFAQSNNSQYTIPFNFSGLVWLTLKVERSSNFQLQAIGADYRAYSYDFALTFQTLSFQDNNQNNSVPTTCFNGENNMCYSCNGGYFLNIDTQQCELSCPECYLSSIIERRCYKAECPPPPPVVPVDVGSNTPEVPKSNDTNVTDSGNSNYTNTNNDTGSTSNNQNSTDISLNSTATGSIDPPKVNSTNTTDIENTKNNTNTSNDQGANTNSIDTGNPNNNQSNTDTITNSIDTGNVDPPKVNDTNTVENGGLVDVPKVKDTNTSNDQNKDIPINDNTNSMNTGNINTTDNTDIPKNDTSDILLCAYKDPISYISQCSYCPPGSVFDIQAKSCKTLPTLSITGPDQVAFCSDLILVASMNPVEELFLTPIKYTWSVTITPETLNSNLLQDYLKTQSLKEIIISASFLKVGAQYTFQVQYLNFFNNTISSTFSTSVVSGGPPQISIDGEAKQAFYHYQENILKARVAYSESCFDLTVPLKAEWTQISEPEIDLSTETTAMPSAFWLVLSQCTLEPGNTYEFEVRVWREDFPDSMAIARTEFHVPPVNFTVEIESGSRQVSASSEITLKSRLNYRIGNCPVVEDNMEITYQWTCEKKFMLDSKEGYNICQDPSGLFSFPKKDSSIQIPVSYFKQGETMRIGVTAQKNGDYTQTFVILEVVDSTELSISLERVNYKLGVDPQELLFLGNVDNNGGPVSYNWAVTPSLRVISYQNQLKLMNDYQTLDNQYISVQLNAQVAGQKTIKSAVLIPRNPAPKRGSLIVTPTSGYSLSTYFHIAAADWKDDDAPLSYEFFYFFEDGQELRLTDLQKSQHVYTMLPGNGTSTQLTIKVIVRDSLGAVNSAETTLEVISNRGNLTNALANIKQNFADITKQGNEAVLKAEPFEMFKTLTFFAQELASYENLDPSHNGDYMSLKTKREMLNFKIALINNIQAVHSLIPYADTDEILIQTVNTLIYNTVFNFPDSLLATVRAMRDNLKNKITLSAADISNTADIITNILANFNAESYERTEAKELRDFTDTWLNKISANALKDKLPGETPIIIESKNFDVFIARTTGCSMIYNPIRTSLDSPMLEFEVLKDFENSPIFACDKVYSNIYYAFNPNASSAQVNAQKSMISLAVADAENKIASLPVTYLLTETNYCPESCVVRPNGVCGCASTLQFGQEYVLDILFGLNEKEFNIWELLPLQINLVSLIWLIFTLLIVRYLIRNYCQMKNFEASSDKTRFKALITALWISPKLLEIYTYNNKDLPKTRRAFLYFLRIQLFSVLACALASKNTKAQIDEILLERFNYTVPYYVLMFLIPYVTIIPLQALLEVLLKNYNSPRISAAYLNNTEGYEAVSIQRTESQPQPVQLRNSKRVFILGVLLGLVILGGSEVYTWNVGLKDIPKQQGSAWLSYLLLGLVIDLVITPLVLNIANYIGTMIWAAKFVQKGKFMKKFLESAIDHKILKLKKELQRNSKDMQLAYKRTITDLLPIENSKVAPDRQIPVGIPVNMEVACQK